jgi:hypothetical protein
VYGFSKLAALERVVGQDAIGTQETISLGGLCRVTRHKNHRKVWSGCPNLFGKLRTA